MTKTMESKMNVKFHSEALYIEDSPVIVLCSSLFYFRIPRGLWRDRIKKVKEAGYNCIDVYFPWNYHELHEGEWDFTGERDVKAFLRMVSEEGLWVVARPGPYICSEWDGGGLPSFLFTHEVMRLRDNDPLFLTYVGKWFDQIMPMIQQFEVGEEGTVIAVQLENELDFYDCKDRTGYISSLREMAVKHHIEVPLFACAGQGDLFGATGNALGVMPTCNFYPNDRDLEFEAKVMQYYDELQTRKVPLCVTETNRSHFLLRRLLSCGAKLLGPYLQTSGTNFGFTNAINNWGKPLAYLTSDYDFQGMISSTGQVREEANEGRLLSQLICSLGVTIAKAAPKRNHGLRVETDLTLTEGGPYVLELSEGGYVVALPNVDDRAGTMTIYSQDSFYPRYTQLTISPSQCPLLLQDVPLSIWGMQGEIVYATGELGVVKVIGNDRTVMVFHTETEAEVSFSFPSEAVFRSEGMTVHKEGDRATLCFDHRGISRCNIQFSDGSMIDIVGLDHHQASRMEVSTSGELLLNHMNHVVSSHESFLNDQKVKWSTSVLNDAGISLFEQKTNLGPKPKKLEEVGILRGFGWYGARIESENLGSIQGILLHNASDILSVYCNGHYHGTVNPGGGCEYISTSIAADEKMMELVIRTEIWGHTNFDDSLLPSLRLHSLKGLGGLVAITNMKDLGENWRFHSEINGFPRDEFYKVELNDSGWVITGWGSWLATNQPNGAYYRKSFIPSMDTDSWTLHFQGLQAKALLYVSGQFVGVVNPFNPYMDISAYVQPEGPTQITLYLERFFNQAVGKVLLLEGRSATVWWVAGSGESELWEKSKKAKPKSVETLLPFHLPSGKVGWLFGEMIEVPPGCLTVKCTGQNAKISAFFNGRLVGRLWLSSKSRPAFSGGNQEIFYLPEPWFQQEANRLAILIEAVELNEEAVITGLVFQPIG